ncbi:hypothetical protein LX32DRAFT_635871 [Colletotrichum zoysiae]|uniref:Uncharacterized protein n=1 Tax=Colletotrichum zoysiae TaxID=1216348 RepID=A0AAD9HP81_9PEZI|nr:hypothetical protein LX32DRAFT_635871 [Colletotrichum zoysiae]
MKNIRQGKLKKSVPQPGTPFFRPQRWPSWWAGFCTGPSVETGLVGPESMIC